MVAVVEPVFELLARMPTLAGDDPRDIGHVATGRLLAKDVEAALEAGDGDLGCHVIGDAHEQEVERLVEELPVVLVVPGSVLEASLVWEGLVADGDHLELRVLVDELAPSLADDAVSGDADPELPAHPAAFGNGVR